MWGSVCGPRPRRWHICTLSLNFKGEECDVCTSVYQPLVPSFFRLGLMSASQYDDKALDTVYYFIQSVHYSHVAHSMFHWAHRYGGGQGSHGAQVSHSHQPDHPPAAMLVPIDTFSSRRLLHELLLTLREVSQPGLGRVPMRGEVAPRALVLFSHVP